MAENSLNDGRLYILTDQEIVRCTIIGTTETKETAVKDNSGKDIILKSKVLELLPSHSGSAIDEVSGKPFRFAITSTAHPRVLELVEKYEADGLDTIPEANKTMSITQAMVEFNQAFYVTRRNSKGLLDVIKQADGTDMVARRMPIRKLKGEGAITNADAFKLAQRIMKMGAKGGGFVKEVKDIEADGSYNGIVLSKSSSKQVANDVDEIDIP